MNESLKRFSLLVFIAAAIALFTALRYSIGGLWLAWSAGALLILLVAWDALSLLKTEVLERPLALWTLGWKKCVLFAFGLALIARNNPAHAAYPYLFAVSLAAAIIGLFVGLGLEIANLRANYLDSPEAVKARAASSLTLALLFLGLLGLNFAANRRDHSFDLTYLKSSKAGASTLAIVQGLRQPVKVGVVFSRDSESLPYVKEYFSGIHSDQVQLEYFDKDYDPARSESYRVAKNGQIVLMQGERRQRFDIGDRLEDARRNLKTLDATFQKELLALTSPPAIIYFTGTHGEMNYEAGGGSPLRKIVAMEELLRNQNFKARRLTAMFREVPDDAKVVAVIGPTTGFLPEELEALKRYVDKGGRLFLAMDIDKGVEDVNGLAPLGNELDAFVRGFGLHYDRVPIANEEKFVTSTRQKTDRYLLYTNTYGIHPATKTLVQNQTRLAYMTFHSGSFDILADKQGWTLTPLISTLKSTFRDANGDIEASPGEKHDAFPLVVSGEAPQKGRFVAFADATSLSDALLKSAGNQLAMLDTFRWLVDRSEQSGAIESEDDVQIRHENVKDLALFHGSIYGVPLLVLAIGYRMNRRRKSKV